MRLDEAGPRTWLLAAVAGWAVLLWLLALAGMGSRIAALPADAALAQPLPAIAPAAPGRLAARGEYRAIGARPLLSPTRRPQPFSLVPEGDGAPAEERFEFVLTGVLMTPDLQMAILQPVGGGESVRLRVGAAPDSAPSWRLASLSPRSAVFAGPDGERTLELRSYDGGADMRGAAPVPTFRVEGEGEDQAMPVAPAQAAEAAEPAMVEDAEAPTPEDQMEAIRRRIEARREQLRREARQSAPASPPPPQQR